jgi:2-C-methyl-D-erythritol 2,4-cyclodiphosphate synthase
MYRIGFSRDIHRLEANGKDFILGGVKIPFILGNVAHSDGDCLYHAISESLLGSLGLGDLGKFFPDTDDKYLGMDSSIIMKECFKMVKDNGYVINNLDCVIVLEKPHLQKHLPQMKLNICELLETDESNVCIKAQTNEKCGEVGNNQAIICFATVLLRKEK